MWAHKSAIFVRLLVVVAARGIRENKLRNDVVNGEEIAKFICLHSETLLAKLSAITEVCR